jgi:hypothetical protein
MQLKINPTESKKATKSGSLQGMSNPLRKIIIPMNLLVMRANLPENDPEKLQFIKLVTPAVHSSGPGHQGRNYSSFVGWVTVGARVQIFNVGELMVYLITQTATKSPANINI